jgi:MerR family redox-sensitive transcriptional activator SoxR
VIPIGEVAQRAGLNTSAVRYYERIGLLPAPARASGRRHYTEDVLLRLQVIRFARASGFTLGEVQRLFAGRPYSIRLRDLARSKIDELEDTITRARAMQALLERALRCRCLTLEECGARIARATSKEG